MKKPSTFLSLSFLLFGIAFNSHAQTSPILKLKAAPANISINGDIREWGDSLTYYSPEEHLAYDMVNGKDTLYLAIKVYDRSEMARILDAGLTFGFDPKGKKKEAYSFTYPVFMERTTPLLTHGNDSNNISDDDRDDLVHAKITSLRGISVTGVKDIEDNLITTSNTYGIQADVNYDAKGNLVCEMAIPFKYIHVENNPKDPWGFTIKINGLQRPESTEEGGEGGEGSGRHGGGGGGMGGGMGGGRHGGGGHGGGGKRGGGAAPQGEIFKSVDFWGRFYFAQ